VTVTLDENAPSTTRMEKSFMSELSSMESFQSTLSHPHLQFNSTIVRTFAFS
jgi:hypothetical protein